MSEAGSEQRPIGALAGHSAHPPVSRSAGYRHQEILRAQCMAALVVGVWGVMFFGRAAASVLMISIIAATAADAVIAAVIRRPVVGGFWHSGLTGLLLGLTLPATVSWYVPLIGSVVAICAKTVFGGLGHYLCHPALVGRVFVQVFFSSTLSFFGSSAGEPVLTRSHLFYGALDGAESVELSSYEGWPRTSGSVVAIKYERPVRRLRDYSEGEIKPEAGLRLTPLIRDYLPPWQDTILGAVPGGIGETPTLAIVVAGLYLIYRGYLRWHLPVSILVSAALAAAILPVQGWGAGGAYRWFEILRVEGGLPVGLAYVLYHLTAGQLMLAAFLLAGDMTVSPKRAVGQALFGAGIGVLSIFMRLYGLLEGECYWSILIFNFLVPVIDRRMRRSVLGIEEVG